MQRINKKLMKQVLALECYKFYMKWPQVEDSVQGFFQQFWEKAPDQNWEKMIDLTSKLGETTKNITRVEKYILKIKLF